MDSQERYLKDMAYEMGVSAASLGDSFLTNPFNEDDEYDLWEAWNTGYTDESE